MVKFITSDNHPTRLTQQLPIEKRGMKVATKYILVAALAGFLHACSDSDGRPDALTIDEQQLAEMFSAGTYADIIEIVRQKDRKGLATSEDFLLAAKANIATFDQIGAAIAIEKIKPLELDDLDEFILVQGQSLMLEQRFVEASKFILGHKFSQPLLSFQSRVLLGDLATLQDMTEEALGFYNDAIALNPEDFRTHISRAQALLALSRFNEAEDAARTAVALASNNSMAHYTLGTVYTMQGKQNAAKEEFEQAVYSNEENVQAMLELVRISIVEQDYASAERHLDAIYSLTPADNTARYYSSILLALSGNDIAAQKALLVPTLQERNNPHVIRLQGHLAYRLNDLTLARSKFEQSLRIAPYDRATLLALADIYIQQESAAQALEILRPMLSADSTDIAAFSMAGLAAAQVGDLRRAIAYSQRTIELAEDPETILDGAPVAELINADSIKILKRRLATYYFRQGEKERAFDALRWLVKEDASDETSTLLLFNLLIDDGNNEAALAVANQLIAALPEAAAGYNAKGTALHRQGDLEQAQEAYTQAIELKADYASALKNRAGLFLSKNEFLAAREDLGRVLDVTPTDVQAQLMYVTALVETGRATEAMGYFPTIFRAFPNSLNAQILHARALGMTDEYEKAIEEIEAILATLGPDRSDIKEYLNTLVEDYKQILFEATIE